MKPRIHLARIAVIAMMSLGVLAGSTSAKAQVLNEWAEPGGYLVIAGMNSFDAFHNTPKDFKNSWGFNVRGGYRANPFLAAEVSLDFLTGFQTQVPVPPILIPPALPGSTAPFILDGGNVTVNAKGYLPWFGRFQPYGLLGMGGMWNRLRTGFVTGVACSPIYWWCSGSYTSLGTTGGFAMKFGGGAELWFTEDFGLLVDAYYLLPFGAPKDLAYTSLSWGAIFRF